MKKYRTDFAVYLHALTSMREPQVLHAFNLHFSSYFFPYSFTTAVRKELTALPEFKSLKAARDIESTKL